MVQRCIVRGCGSEWYPGTHINYNTFHKNSVQRSLWLAVIPLKSKFYESARICSLHFKASDYDLPSKRLKATAVPYYNENGTDKYNVSSISQIYNEANIPVKNIEVGVQVKIKTTTEENLHKQNKALKQKVVLQNKCIKNMESLIAVVKKYTDHSEIENIIQGRFSDLCKELNKPPANPHGVRYSEEVKAFALTLHYYSPKAYEFIRSVTALPHVATLRRSLSLFNCNVGCITEVFEYLKTQVQLPEKQYLKNVALIFDGMSLKQDLAYDQKLDKVFGYVDLGPIPVSDPENLCIGKLFSVNNIL